jgi:hypothetical protein
VNRPGSGRVTPDLDRGIVARHAGDSAAGVRARTTVILQVVKDLSLAVAEAQALGIELPALRTALNGWAEGHPPQRATSPRRPPSHPRTSH